MQGSRIEKFSLKIYPMFNFAAFRSSPPEVLCKKAVLKSFTQFQGKHLCQSLFFRRQPTTLLKNRPWHRCFPVNFEKYLRTPFFIGHLR